MARVLPNGSLLLPAIGIQDEGTFRCRAMSRNGKETKSNYHVRVYRKGPRAFPKAHLSPKEEPSTPALKSLALLCEPLTLLPHPHNGGVRLFKAPASDCNFPPSETPKKPEIVDPASELMAGVSNKVVEEKGSRKWSWEW